jgi:hypothetical protein
VERRSSFDVCDPSAVRELVSELLCWRRDSPFILEALDVWSVLVRSEADLEAVEWMAAQLHALGLPPTAPMTSASTSRASGPASAPAAYEAFASAAVARANELREFGTLASCDGPAMRAIALAREVVPLESRGGIALLVDCWARLLGAPAGRDGSSRDPPAALAELLDLAESAAVQGFVERVKGAPIHLEESIASQLSTGAFCWRGLQWLSASDAATKPPRRALGALARLGAKAALGEVGAATGGVVGTEAQLSMALTLFERHHDAPECATFVELIAESPHGLTLLPAALKWLAHVTGLGPARRHAFAHSCNARPVCDASHAYASPRLY